MMKIVIVSDSHGYNQLIDQVLEREAPFDYLIHCGDAEASLKRYADLTNPYLFLAVRGNCDQDYNLPAVLNNRILYYNVLITHGHHEQVNYGNHGLLRIGRLNHADIILYGHTHVPEVTEDGGILIINPGSLAYPRGEKRIKTYAVLTLTDDYDRDVEIRELS